MTACGPSPVTSEEKAGMSGLPGPPPSHSSGSIDTSIDILNSRQIVATSKRSGCRSPGLDTKTRMRSGLLFIKPQLYHLVKQSSLILPLASCQEVLVIHCCSTYQHE